MAKMRLDMALCQWCSHTEASQAFSPGNLIFNFCPARMSRIAMTCLKTCLDPNSTKNIQKSPSHGNRARTSVAISPIIIGRF